MYDQQALKFPGESDQTELYTPQTQVLTGLIHSELESALFKAIAERRAQDSTKPIVVVCGSRLLSTYLTNSILNQARSLFNIHLISYYKLRNTLALFKHTDEVKPDKPALASEVCALMATHNCEEGYFSNILDKPGFQRALAATFADMDDSSFDFASRISTMPDSVKSEKWLALGNLYQSYRDAMGQFEDHGQLDQINDLAEAFEQIFGCRDLIFYGFYDFTGCQFELVRRLAGQIDTSFYVPYYKPNDTYGSAFDYSENAVNALLKLPGAKHIQLNPIGGCAFKGFGTRLFRYKPEEASHAFCPPSRRIHYLRAGNPVVEVASIVSRINKHCLWDSIRLDQVGILLWDTDLYRPLLIQALEEAGIPYYDSLGSRLVNSTAGRILTTLLHITRRQIKRRELIDFIADFRLNLNDETESIPADVIAWERISIEAGLIEGGHKDWAAKLDSYTKYINHDDKTSKDFTDQINLFEQFIERLFRHADAFPESASLDTFARHTLALAKDFLLVDAFNSVEPVISGFFQFDIIPAKCTRRSYETLLSRALAGKIQRYNRQNNGVMICDRMAARGVAFDALFIPGLCQGSVPTSPQDDPILPDSERQSLTSKDNGNPFDLPLKGKRRIEERLLFALAVDSAQTHLYLSYPDRDIDKGAQTFPSRYLLDVARIVLGRQVDGEVLSQLPQFEDDLPSPDDNSTGQLTPEQITSPEMFTSEWVQANIPAPDRSAVMRALMIQTIPLYKNALEATFARANENFLSEWDGILPIEYTKDIFTVTELEAYCQCPFRYFITRILEVDVLEEPETMLELPPSLLGSIIHSILQKLFDLAKRDSSEPLKSKNTSWFVGQLPELVQNELRRRHPECQAPDIVWILEEKRLLLRLERFLRKHIPSADEFTYTDGELKLASELTFQHDETETKIKIVGRVDRVDKTADKKAVRIIDYKTGSKPGKVDKLNGGANLQLPLYLKALLSEDSNLEDSLSLSEYLTIGRDGKASSGGINGQKLAEMEENLSLLISTVTSAMQKGHFPPFPSIPKNEICKSCRFIETCSRLSRDKVTARVNDDYPIFAIRSIDV